MQDKEEKKSGREKEKENEMRENKSIWYKLAMILWVKY